MSSRDTKAFDYTLPESAIAQQPAERGASRLLVVDAEGEERHRSVQDLATLLRPDDLLVVNDTRVIPARLFARRRPGGGKTELLLVEKAGPSLWDALVKPARRATPGTWLDLEDGLTAEVIEKGVGGLRRLRFTQEIEDFIERRGHVPLPPYIRRDDDLQDRTSYQTPFARHPGAIAAPTAGLHFEEGLLAELADRGIRRVAVTLHVGIGTFKPVDVDRIDAHRMETERFHVSEEAASAIHETRAAGGRVVAVGTTVVRTLESVVQATGVVTAGSGRTELFITPGFRFRVVDALLTNFHLPRSTLLMLVSALAGPGDSGRRRILAAYEEALRREYRFYSYGDAMFLQRRDT